MVANLTENLLHSRQIAVRGVELVGAVFRRRHVDVLPKVEQGPVDKQVLDCCNEREPGLVVGSEGALILQPHLLLQEISTHSDSDALVELAEQFATGALMVCWGQVYSRCAFAKRH